MFSEKQFLKFMNGAMVKLVIVFVGFLVFYLAPASGSNSALAQVRQSTMEQRLNDDLEHLQKVKGCPSETTIVQNMLQKVTANMVPVSQETNPVIASTIARAADGLTNYIQQPERCAEAQGMAIDVKQVLNETEEVTRAVLPALKQCREGARVDRDCPLLQASLDEETGREVFEPPSQLAAANLIIKPGFSVKLRGPFIPPYIREMKEDVRVTNPIGPGQCVVVFKETRGLMLRLIFVRMTVVQDPWATPQLLRGTLVPVWALQWVPSEYVKEWNICNLNGTIKKTVTQRVVQDVPLNYFWRFYPKDP